MHAYTIALFVHLCALFAAFGATALIGLGLKRIRSARTCGEALQWLGLGKSAARAFPLVLLTLAGSGAYMVHGVWSWSTPWVDAGLTGVLLLGVVGDRLGGGRARKIARLLAADPGAPIAGRPAAAVHDPLFWTASVVNPCIALGVAFDMATKPGAAGAAAALAGAVAVGSAAAVPLWWPRTAESPEAMTAG